MNKILILLSGCVLLGLAGCGSTAPATEAEETQMEAAINQLKAAGAPVDAGPVAVAAWAIQNPWLALGLTGALALYGRAWITGFLAKRAAKSAAAANLAKQAEVAKDGLTAVVKAVEAQPPEVKEKVKSAVAAQPLSYPEVREEIEAVKA